MATAPLWPLDAAAIDRSGAVPPPWSVPFITVRRRVPKPLEKTQLLRWPKPRRAQATLSRQGRCLAASGGALRAHAITAACRRQCPERPVAGRGDGPGDGLWWHPPRCSLSISTSCLPSLLPVCSTRSELYWLRTGGAGAIWRSGGWRGSSA